MAKKRKNPMFDGEKVDAFLNAVLKGEDTSSATKENPRLQSKRKNPFVDFDELEISNPLSNLENDVDDSSDEEDDFEDEEYDFEEDEDSDDFEEDFEDEDSDDFEEDEEESFLMRTNPIDVPNWFWVGGAVALVGGLGYWYFTRKTE